MIDLSKLPIGFDELELKGVDGYSLSYRLIDPVIIIDKSASNIFACLGGVRSIAGERKIYYAPSNRHSWVVDEKIIRPLPRDAVELFKEALGGCDPEDLSYVEAVRLACEFDMPLGVVSTKFFLMSGALAADHYTQDLVIPSLKADLFPYQARGVQWMWNTLNQSGGLILADEMGLGKTLQVIALLLLELPQYDSPALIICPASLIANWSREIEKFTTGVIVLIHRGANRTGIYCDLQKANVVITTYDTMVNDISIFSSFEWSWVICDEAQSIKNPDSNRRRAIATIPRKRSIPMTGTPVENSLLDLWSLADFAIPGLLGSRESFERSYSNTLESANLISDITDPIVLKRQLIEVAGDLPERIDIDVPLELDNDLVDFYLHVRKLTIEKYPVAGALVATLQLQLVCAHPWLIKNFSSDVDVDADDAGINYGSAAPLMTPKMDRAISIIVEAFFSGKKVLLFSVFNKVEFLIKKALLSYPNSFFWGAINGSTPPEDRQSIVDEFSEFGGAGCLILNPKAAGAGLNITAATVVIHFTPVWNPALESQASARAHRRGQCQPVTIYHLFYKDTVEEVMVERSAWKRALANQSVPVSSRDNVDFTRALQIAPEKTQ
ncbi:DEAD/DEAH box helicase [Pseudomonas syringae]|uniref:DEAD/DEAH box helicase n=1 Tax=Pseudomonas syringae TaxID=317 RepID=UPI003F854A28